MKVITQEPPRVKRRQFYYDPIEEWYQDGKENLLENIPPVEEDSNASLQETELISKILTLFDGQVVVTSPREK